MESEIADAVEELIGILEPHTIFLNELVSDGGRGAIIVSAHSHHNFAVELSPEALGRLSSLRLSFWIDYYPGPFVP